MDKVIQVVSPEESDRITRERNHAMTPEERLAVQNRLIMMYYGDNPPRLERILTIARREKCVK
jgi:hypothetical protein